jgi:hypothetical protein
MIRLLYRFLIFAGIVSTLFFAVPPLAKKLSNQNDGFALTSILSDLPHQKEWELTQQQLSPFQLRELTRQPFTYLAKGAQSYVFLSDDKKTVIKVFKYKHLRRRPWLDSLPLPSFLEHYRTRSLERREKRLQQQFESYRIAAKTLQDEAGILYAQLNVDPELEGEVELIDFCGNSHKLPLGNLTFILQRRGDPLKETLLNLKESKAIYEAKVLVKALEDCVLSRLKKGVVDTDPAFLQNYAFHGSKGIQLDVGCLEELEIVDPNALKERQQQEMAQLHSWLESHFPEVL